MACLTGGASHLEPTFDRTPAVSPKCLHVWKQHASVQQTTSITTAASVLAGALPCAAECAIRRKSSQLQEREPVVIVKSLAACSASCSTIVST